MGTRINISDDVCWICGKGFGPGKLACTGHHVLPRHLNPVKNLIVPVHQGCHDRINADDTAGLTAFAFKLVKEAKEISHLASVLVNTLIKIKELKEGKKITLGGK